MSRTLKKQARKLAKKGRYGDKHLLHVNDAELSQLIRAGKVHKNPETGLPEAWNPFSGDFSLGGSFDNIRNFGEAAVGGNLVGGALGISPGVGEAIGGINDLQNPGGATDTALRDIGGGATIAAGAYFGGEAAGLWGGGAAGGAGAADTAPFYGDLAPEWAGSAGAGGAEAGAGAGAGDQLFADSWAANASAGAPAVGTGAGMSLQQMMMLGMGGISAVGGAAGLYNAYQGRQLQKQQQKQQQEYFDRLNNLMDNPGQVTSLPGYQFNLEQGQDALQRRMASMGYGTSGNLATAMTRFGSDYSTGVLGQQEQLLASQYGRASPPTATMPDPTSLAMNSLSNMGYGFAPFMFSGQG